MLKAPTFAFKRLSPLCAIFIVVVRSIETDDVVETFTSPSPSSTPHYGQCPSQCDCFNYDETVDCSHRGLDHLPKFSHNTKRLYLEDNRIAFISDDFFLVAGNLLLLVLERNEMTFINTSSFCNLHRLQELDLGGNRIQSFIVVPNNCSAWNLKEINLSLNLLTRLPIALSRFAPNLEILNLSYNEIEGAAVDESYSQMTNLRHLDLSRNKIHWILSDDFKALRTTPLEILNLAESGISRIENGSLDGLLNLSSLSLANNMLNHKNVESILSSLFAPNVSSNFMNRLDLSEILLPNLTVRMLGRFKELSILDVSICDVEFIEPELFSHLSSLETLHAEFGKLTKLENLSSSKKLRRIYLQDNRLTMLNISELFGLESLDLSYNHFQIIPNLWLVGLRNLQILNLSHNHIHHIAESAFKQSSIILTFDLSFNNLQTIDNFGLSRLSKLDVSHNFISSIGLNIFQHLRQTLSDVDLSYNNLTDFDGNIFSSTPNIQTLNLAGNKLYRIFSKSYNHENQPFSNLQFLKMLDLSENGLDFVDCNIFSQLHNLVTLSLKNNKFKQTKDAGLLCVATLVKLVMSGNLLTSVDVDVLKMFSNMEELDLSSNPFDCNCDIVPFLLWVNSTQVRIVKESDDDNYKCSSIGNPKDMNIKSSVSTNWDGDNFLFMYRSEYDLCSLSSSDFSSSHKDFSASPSSLKLNTPLEAAKYLTVFGTTALSGVLVGMTVIFIAWKYRNSFHQMKLLSPRWRVRYREVSDLEAALDSRTGI